MAAQFDTRMNEFNLLPRKRLIDGIKLILPTVLLVAVMFWFLRRANQTLFPLALDFATAAGVGLAAGLSTRWSLKGRAGLLHILVAVAVMISGLIILGLATAGQAGIQMLVYRRDVDWNGLGQVTIGAASALLGLRAFKRSIQILPVPPAAPERVVPRVSPQPATISRRRRRSGVTASARRNGARGVWAPGMARIIAIPHWKAPHITLPHWRAPHITFPHWRAPHINFPHINLRDLLHANDSAIKVNGVTEQRCPYCLDEIIQNDPRGVRVCSICHTPHHADCWAMTGMCQIPHYHA